MNRDTFLQALKKSGEDRNIPNISWETVRVLRFFLRLLRPQKVLEIGGANGFSTVVMGDVLEEWVGKLFSVERSIPSFQEAQENIKKAKLDNVFLFFGDALSVDMGENAPFDMIFIDAEKKQTHLLFAIAEKLLSPKGIIIIDDVRLFPEKMKAFYEMKEGKKERWYFLEIPTEPGDAVMVATRK